MSPQRSNRSALVEGTLRLLEREPPERITARAIAAESGANLASIAYHFGSKDELVTAAVITGLDRWLDEIADELSRSGGQTPNERLRAAALALGPSRMKHAGLARNFLGALARAPHDEPVRDLLVEGFSHTRPGLAAVLGLGDDDIAEDAGGLVHAMFVGLLFEALLDPDLMIEGKPLPSRFSTGMAVAVAGGVLGWCEGCTRVRPIAPKSGRAMERA